jgi:plastocyanin
LILGGWRAARRLPSEYLEDVMTCRVVVSIVLVGFLTGCGSSTPSGPTTGSGGGSGTAVTIVSGSSTLGSSAYAPNPVTIASGTTVTWTNNDSITHTSSSDTPGVFDSGSIPAGGKFSFTFQTKGTVSYHCSIHPGMVGTIVVQ